MARVSRVVIIGGGPGGYEAALVAAQLGADVTVVDSDGLGGSAVLTDCVPSKTLIATAELMTDVEGAHELGVSIGAQPGESGVSVDLARINKRVKALAQAQSEDIGRRLEREGVRVVAGRARLDGPARVVAETPDGEETVEADAFDFLKRAERARERGMTVVMGGPNLIRGGSYSGNVPAADLAHADLLDAFASDYVPRSLIECAFAMTNGQFGWSLPKAAALVTATPAKAVGLEDRGVIEPGRRADLLRVRVAGGLPVVRGVFPPVWSWPLSGLCFLIPVITVGGLSALDNFATVPSAGTAFVVLKDWGERGKAKDQGLRTIYERLQGGDRFGGQRQVLHEHRQQF